MDVSLQLFNIFHQKYDSVSVKIEGLINMTKEILNDDLKHLNLILEEDNNLIFLKIFSLNVYIKFYYKTVYWFSGNWTNGLLK